MLEPPILETERLYVRMLADGDVAEVIRYYGENEEHLRHSRPRVPPDFYGEEFWKRQVHAALAEFRTDRSLRLFLYAKPGNDRIVGNVNFTGFNRGAAQFCYLGYGIDRGHEGQGLMREGVEAAIRYVFETLNMHRIMANYVPWNRRSGGLLRRMSFTVEGYARDYLFLDGRWEDHVMTSLTNPAWREGAT